MTDRELLELAAKAAGMIQDTPGWQHESLTVLASDGGWRRWNPLTDDGDALRLAVRLGIEIIPDIEVSSTHTAFMVGRSGQNTFEDWTNSGEESTRRAIVRAAAEIGRQRAIES